MISSATRIERLAPAYALAATNYHSGSHGLKRPFIAAAIPGAISAFALANGIYPETVGGMNLLAMCGTAFVLHPLAVSVHLVSHFVGAGKLSTRALNVAVPIGAFAAGVTSSAAATGAFSTAPTTTGAAAATIMAATIGLAAKDIDLQKQGGIFKRVFTAAAAGSVVSAALTFGGAMLPHDKPTMPTPQKDTPVLLNSRRFSDVGPSQS